MDPNAMSKCCGVKVTEPHKPDCPIIKISKEVLGEVEKDETMHHILKLQIAIAVFLIRTTAINNDSISMRIEKNLLKEQMKEAQKFLDKE